MHVHGTYIHTYTVYIHPHTRIKARKFHAHIQMYVRTCIRIQPINIVISDLTMCHISVPHSHLHACTHIYIVYTYTINIRMCKRVYVLHLQSSDEEVEEFEVELLKRNKGLGITIAGLVKNDTGGIYIPGCTSVGRMGYKTRLGVCSKITLVRTNLRVYVTSIAYKA